MELHLTPRGIHQKHLWDVKAMDVKRWRCACFYRQQHTQDECSKSYISPLSCPASPGFSLQLDLLEAGFAASALGSAQGSDLPASDQFETRFSVVFCILDRND